MVLDDCKLSILHFFFLNIIQLHVISKKIKWNIFYIQFTFFWRRLPSHPIWDIRTLHWRRSWIISQFIFLIHNLHSLISIDITRSIIWPSNIKPMLLLTESDIPAELSNFVEEANCETLKTISWCNPTGPRKLIIYLIFFFLRATT